MVSTPVAGKTQYHKFWQEGEAPGPGKRNMFYASTFREERVQTARETPSYMEGPRSSKQVRSAAGQRVSDGITLCLGASARVGHSPLLVNEWGRSIIKPEKQLRAWGLRWKSPGYLGWDWTQLPCKPKLRPKLSARAWRKKNKLLCTKKLALFT